MAGKQGMSREALEASSKDDLVARAEALGIDGARKFTRAELVDEIVRALGGGDRGLFGRARDLLREVVERGLTRAQEPARASRPGRSGIDTQASLVGAAPADRGPSVSGSSSDGSVGEGSTAEAPSERSEPATAPVGPEAPVPTVTLAEIYLAQGHTARAIAMLREVVRLDAGDAVARALLDRLEPRTGRAPAHPADRVEPEGVEASTLDPYAAIGLEPEAFVEPVEPPAPVVPPMLDDRPLPARYGVDECVAMAVDPTTVYAYWELRRATVERARRVLARAGGDEPRSVLRVLVVEPDLAGPRSSTRDFSIDDVEFGEWFVRDLPSGSIVRVAVGVAAGARFLPLAHTHDVEAPPSEPSAAIVQEVVTWREEPAETPSAVEPETLDAPTLRPSMVPTVRPLASPLPRDLGTFGLPPMPPSPDPGPAGMGRGLSSGELSSPKRARLERAREAVRAGAGPTSASWVSR